MCMGLRACMRVCMLGGGCMHVYGWLGVRVCEWGWVFVGGDGSGDGGFGCTCVSMYMCVCV